MITAFLGTALAGAPAIDLVERTVSLPAGATAAAFGDDGTGQAELTYRMVEQIGDSATQVDRLLPMPPGAEDRWCAATAAGRPLAVFQRDDGCWVVGGSWV